MRRVAVALKAITPKDKMIAGLLITILLEICGFGGLLVAVSGGGAVAGVCAGVGSLLLAVGMLYLLAGGE